jgi:flagellar biogenesis protein FliO
MKPESMALATGFDVATNCLLAPKAIAYGSGKSPFSLAHIAPVLFLLVVLSAPAIGQQTFHDEGALSARGTTTGRTTSSGVTPAIFQTPPNFEKSPQRVPTRAANPIAFSNEADQEWLPANQRMAASVPVTSPATTSAVSLATPSTQPDLRYQNTDVQQASFTTSNAPSNQDLSGSNQSRPRSGIPLKPPSKETKDLAPSKSSNSWSSAISMVFSLLLVIGLFLGLSWVFRKTSPSAGALLPKEVVEIIGRTPMANRQQLYVIRFGRKLVLVSQQVGQTEVLSEIEDRTEVDHLLGLCEQTNSRSVSSSFRNVLQQVATSTESKWSLRQRRSTPRTSSLDTLS